MSIGAVIKKLRKEFYTRTACRICRYFSTGNFTMGMRQECTGCLPNSGVGTDIQCQCRCYS